jgi:predicted NBD/HSP70 family sugar kinase/biotin operon repressor
VDDLGVGSLESLRARNRRRVLDALRAAGTASRADLARRTGLSRSTVSSLIADLQSAGLVAEVAGRGRAAPSGQGGRPPVLLELGRSAGVAVGIDFGHRHLRVAVADLGHRVLAEAVRTLEAQHRAAEGLDQAARLVDQVLGQAGTGHDRVIGVGMGLPGPIDRTTGTVGSPTLLPGWVGVRAAERLGELLGLPVQVDNDANLGVLAECTWGAGQGCTEVAYLKAATGIGAGLVLGGRLYVGASGTAGEIGHTTIDEHGPVCRCGNRGCLEMLAGAPAILELLRPGLGERLTLAEVLRLAAAGDPGCRRVLADAGRHIGVAVANLCNLFNPERVIVGGELARAGDLLLEPLREVVRRGSIQSALQTARIVPGVLGDRAEVLGAVALVLRESDRFVSLHPSAAGAAG